MTTGGPDILVQKFGGTSLASTADLRRVAGIVRQAYNGVADDSAKPVVVVVSARGDTTNELIDLAAEVSAAPPGRELDQLLATGEVASAALLAIALVDLGIPAVSLDGRQAGIAAVGQPGHGVVTAIDTVRIRKLLADGKVVVVAGFQGVNDVGDVVTLGRGGSDTTAVALSAALGQYHCHIYTDVDGIYSSDPRKVRSARRLPGIGLAEAAELAFAGAKVLHHRAGGLAVANDIELTISSSLHPGPGTVARSRPAQIIAEGGVVAVALDADVVKVSIAGADLVERALIALAEDRGPIDVFAWQRDHAVFTVRGEQIRSLREALRVGDPEPGADVVIAENVTKISAVGRGLLGSAEYLARVLSALGSAGVQIDTVRAEQSRISVLVPSDRGVAAAAALHSEFALDNP